MTGELNALASVDRTSVTTPIAGIAFIDLAFAGRSSELAPASAAGARQVSTSRTGKKESEAKKRPRVFLFAQAGFLIDDLMATIEMRGRSPHFVSFVLHMSSI
ncbi:hypothetical protein [Stieleria sp.]|uniref:hypothetical protein n=1 Tax=Stieleria sp. TaxID=2795976 RepID=UPI003563C1AE